MNDKELLELAAKAAGMEGWRFTGSGMSKMLDPSRPESTGSIGADWNPLTDDGDALRLAVKLATQSEPGNGLNIFLHHDESVVYGPGEGFLHKHGNDPYRATRRAIVRAAAEIGRSLP